MRVVELRRVRGPKGLENGVPKAEDWSQTISGSEPLRLVGEAGEPLGIYSPISDYSSLLQLVPYCTKRFSTASLGSFPAREQRVLMRWADAASVVYRETVPLAHGKQVQDTPEKLGNTPFNALVMNNMRPLIYHYDDFKLPVENWVMMVVARGGVEGGELVLPEYGLAFAPEGAAFIGFNGCTTYHGVMEMKPRADDTRVVPHRFSVVFYALRKKAEGAPTS